MLECTGVSLCVAIAVLATRPTGRYDQVGMGADNVTVPLSFINACEVVLTVTGSFRHGAGTYSTAIDLVASGKLPISKIASHRFSFDDGVKAFETSAIGKGPDGRASAKVQISQGTASPKYVHFRDFRTRVFRM